MLFIPFHIPYSFSRDYEIVVAV